MQHIIRILTNMCDVVTEIVCDLLHTWMLKFTQLSKYTLSYINKIRATMKNTILQEKAHNYKK